jgi:ABC-2 type transport system ATP-binding protein
VDVVALCGELAGLPKTAAFQRAHETLNYVGLGDVRYRAVDGFSAGLRQRCKLAAALVHDPDLLILDEPTNGLDPDGRREFLGLVEEVLRTGVSVLLSTHLLPDVQAVCSDVVVIGNGRALKTGTVAELTRGVERGRIVRFSGDARPFLEALTRLGAETAFDALGGDLTVTLPEGGDNRLIFTAARDAGVGVKHLQPASRSLEQVFFETVEAGRARP